MRAARPGAPAPAAPAREDAKQWQAIPNRPTTTPKRECGESFCGSRRSVPLSNRSLGSLGAAAEGVGSRKSASSWARHIVLCFIVPSTERQPLVSAWGPGLFADDTACDVRDEYRALIEDGTGDDSAMRRILDAYADALEDPDDGPVIWLALAFTQSKIGRLDHNLATRALEIIDHDEGMSRWLEQGPNLEARRRAALAQVRAQLTGPQPRRKKLRPPWRHVTSLHAGDVLAYR